MKNGRFDNVTCCDAQDEEKVIVWIEEENEIEDDLWNTAYLRTGKKYFDEEFVK